MIVCVANMGSLRMIFPAVYTHICMYVEIIVISTTDTRSTPVLHCFCIFSIFCGLSRSHSTLLSKLSLRMCATRPKFYSIPLLPPTCQLARNWKISTVGKLTFACACDSWRARVALRQACLCSAHVSGIVDLFVHLFIYLFPSLHNCMLFCVKFRAFWRCICAAHMFRNLKVLTWARQGWTSRALFIFLTHVLVSRHSRVYLFMWRTVLASVQHMHQVVSIYLFMWHTCRAQHTLGVVFFIYLRDIHIF